MVSDKEQNVEIRSHELTLREGELDSRLCDRERTVEDFESAPPKTHADIEKAASDRGSSNAPDSFPAPMMATTIN